MENKPRLLIIDDDETILNLLKTFFEDNGFEVALESKGDSALRYLEKQKPDLVITDLLLPGEHGINIIKVVKKKYLLPVIAISGIYHEDDIDYIVEDFSLEGCFKKPLVLNEILEKVKFILNERAV